MSIVTIEHWCYIEFFCNEDKSYFHTDKIQYLCYLNLILANAPLKSSFPRAPGFGQVGPLIIVTPLQQSRHQSVIFNKQDNKLV